MASPWLTTKLLDLCACCSSPGSIHLKENKVPRKVQGKQPAETKFNTSSAPSLSFCCLVRRDKFRGKKEAAAINQLLIHIPHPSVRGTLTFSRSNIWSIRIYVQSGCLPPGGGERTSTSSSRCLLITYWTPFV